MDTETDEKLHVPRVPKLDYILLDRRWMALSQAGQSEITSKEKISPSQATDRISFNYSDSTS